MPISIVGLNASYGGSKEFADGTQIPEITLYTYNLPRLPEGIREDHYLPYHLGNRSSPYVIDVKVLVEVGMIKVVGLSSTLNGEPPIINFIYDDFPKGGLPAILRYGGSMHTCNLQPPASLVGRQDKQPPYYSKPYRW